MRKLVRRARRRGHQRDLPRGDGQRDDRRAALRRAGGTHRLHRGRGRRSLPDRHRARSRRDEGAGPRGCHGRRLGCAARPGRSRAIGRRQRKLNRTLAARTGQGKPTALRLTGEAGALVERSVREARRLAEHLRARARGGGARRKLAAARRLEELAESAGIVDARIRQRLAGEKITNRVGLPDRSRRPADPQGQAARAHRVRLRRPARRAVREHRRGARDLIVRAASQLGSPNEPDLLPDTAAELDRLNLRPHELALDGGFFPDGVAKTLPQPKRCLSSPGASRPARDAPTGAWPGSASGSRVASSHLKRRYGLRRSRLKGHHGARTWTAWAIPGLQPRHARHPSHLTASPPFGTTRPEHHPKYWNSHALHPRRGRSHSSPVYPGQVVRRASAGARWFGRYPAPLRPGCAGCVRHGLEEEVPVRPGAATAWPGRAPRDHVLQHLSSRGP